MEFFLQFQPTNLRHRGASVVKKVKSMEYSLKIRSVVRIILNDNFMKVRNAVAGEDFCSSLEEI